jgi:glutamate synthase domain-containing protein 2
MAYFRRGKGGKEILAEMGFRSLDEIIGRRDLFGGC